MVSIRLFLVLSDAGHFFMNLLGVWMSSLDVYPGPLPIFNEFIISYDTEFGSSLYSFEIYPLPDRRLAYTVSHPAAWVLLLLTASFAEQKLFLTLLHLFLVSQP